MAEAAKRATTLTTLVIGKVEVTVGLFSTKDKPSALAEFDTAGPNGGRLMARAVAAPTAPDAPRDLDEGVKGDPLAGEAGPVMESPPDELLEQAAGAVRPDQVAGTYARELVEEGTGEVVLPQDIRRGVRLEDDRFIDCTEQLAAIMEETKLDRMEVVGFVDVTRVPRGRVCGSYWIGMGDAKAPYALKVIYEVLRRKRRAAIVKVTKKSRQSLAVVGWAGDALMLYELVWAEDLRPAPQRALAIQNETVSEEALATFSELVDQMGALPEVLDSLRDDAIELREKLRAKAEAGEVPEVIVPKPPAKGTDLMADLEASLSAVSS